ncbi:MAG: hypothetical protein LBQ27_05150 [Clostridiales bacterium]|jgi:hypothetical protein|nr:hypothetical protein [Clostridiales bacterium]
MNTELLQLQSALAKTEKFIRETNQIIIDLVESQLYNDNQRAQKLFNENKELYAKRNECRMKINEIREKIKTLTKE